MSLQLKAGSPSYRRLRLPFTNLTHRRRNHDRNQIISDMYGNQGTRIPSTLILAAGIVGCHFCESACRDSLSWEDEG
ncbi:hypothetical protein BHE90_013048 [Fusarium euwallaceae]|uniref:Uncharacterized protein n=4 Tax=Fusarium solani species complex TaxID=232080 RepID=A0A428TAW8_9HYPO|nr:hypothetical protein CEP51_012757 [Fusarium floridanum]RSL99094.1 hypothetical protein CEP52_009950 [Fusarium oligoseptatum]RSM17343.1 hypothetical protein CDV31_003759 [Fusarium ambrosium]RTE72533.1 hypothetical protein BHE90_013048 [Fusarium euwallaceae]